MTDEFSGQDLRGCLEVATKLREAVRFSRYHLDKAHVLLLVNNRLDDVLVPGFATKAVRGLGIRSERMYSVTYGSDDSADIEECRAMSEPHRFTLPAVEAPSWVNAADKTVGMIHRVLEENDAVTFTTDFVPILNLCKMAKRSEGMRLALRGHVLELETCETHIKYMCVVGTQNSTREVSSVYPVEYLITLLSMADKKMSGCDYNLSVTFAHDVAMHATIAVKGRVWSAYLAPRIEREDL